MSSFQQHPEATPSTPPPFRLDVQVHDLLKNPTARPAAPPLPSSPAQTLPDAVFPQHPELLGEDHPLDHAFDPHRRRWTGPQILRCMRGWLFPYVKSRVLPGDFHPIIAYLFTEWKCNLDCHYCWAFDNRVKGMTEDIARRSIDWLHSTTCRVLALMGGEPLLRPDFVHKIVYYAAKKGFWVYLPTNARLLRPPVIDRLTDAGVATVNFAVDAVEEKPGLPKALNPIRSHFDYLIKRQFRYGYTVFFNMNICRNNMDDIKRLTEIAHENGIATDYHINESPMVEQPHFKHLDDANDTFIRPPDFPRVDELLDFIGCEKPAHELKRAGARPQRIVQRPNLRSALSRAKPADQTSPLVEARQPRSAGQAAKARISAKRAIAAEELVAAETRQRRFQPALTHRFGNPIDVHAIDRGLIHRREEVPHRGTSCLVGELDH